MCRSSNDRGWLLAVLLCWFLFVLAQFAAGAPLISGSTRQVTGITAGVGGADTKVAAASRRVAGTSRAVAGSQREVELSKVSSPHHPRGPRHVVAGPIILFAFDRADLDAGDRDLLASFARRIEHRTDPGRGIALEIHGHTDTIGSSSTTTRSRRFVPSRLRGCWSSCSDVEPRCPWCPTASGARVHGTSDRMVVTIRWVGR